MTDPNPVVVQVDDVTRITLTPWTHGRVRLGVEHAHEDADGGLDWTEPDGSWAYLGAPVVGVLLAEIRRINAEGE